MKDKFGQYFYKLIRPAQFTPFPFDQTDTILHPRHLDEETAEKATLIWVVWKEKEKTVGQDGKRPKESWNKLASSK